MLLYIKDETILRKESRIPKGSPITDACCRYIIEVWRNDGELLYERNLRQPPLGWSCSDNLFFYYEDDNQTGEIDVYCFANALENDTKSCLFKIDLPKEVATLEQLRERPKQLRFRLNDRGEDLRLSLLSKLKGEKHLAWLKLSQK